MLRGAGAITSVAGQWRFVVCLVSSDASSTTIVLGNPSKALSTKKYNRGVSHRHRFTPPATKYQVCLFPPCFPRFRVSTANQPLPRHTTTNLSLTSQVQEQQSPPSYPEERGTKGVGSGCIRNVVWRIRKRPKTVANLPCRDAAFSGF